MFGNSDVRQKRDRTAFPKWKEALQGFQGPLSSNGTESMQKLSRPFQRKQQHQTLKNQCSTSQSICCYGQVFLYGIFGREGGRPGGKQENVSGGFSWKRMRQESTSSATKVFRTIQDSQSGTPCIEDFPKGRSSHQ